MSTPDPRDGVSPAEPTGQAPRKRRNPWVWISVALGVAAIGLLIWALTIQSDLDSSEKDADQLQSELDQTKESGSDVATAAKGLYDDLAQEVGATNEELAQTEQELADAEQAAAQSEEDAAAAKEKAAEADNETDKAKAEAEQANAEAKAAESKASVAADCAKAYISAFGALFEGENVRDQVAIVREQLESISAECQAALAGT